MPQKIDIKTVIRNNPQLAGTVLYPRTYREYLKTGRRPCYATRYMICHELGLDPKNYY